MSSATAPPPLFGPPPRSRLLDVALLLAFIGLAVLLTWPSALVHIDVAVRDTIEADRPGWALALAKVFKFLGLPTIQALAITYVGIWCASMRRSLRPLLPVGAAWLLLAITKQLQPLFDRVFPHWPDCPPVCPEVDTGATGATFFAGQGYDAFPSGHSTATAIWLPLAVWLIPQLPRRWRWFLAITPSVLLTMGQTYLGYHWLSDSIGGILLGVLVLRLIQRVPWGTIPLFPVTLLEKWAAGRRAAIDRRAGSASRSPIWTVSLRRMAARRRSIE
ncbi:PAP2 superfamily protein [Stackebrandtia endophytica]|uniref:PAP2 superfamily protein n=1 Tax=Stackebrandtia endophytica TaxID=1496996 RepID=A0A543B4C2_9ACTN|nr:phosphatase PAP2 family protein [Stackebrandtia endophytica]TQL79685.1 PAP2 superfamily protein [Stackebrandtia endophytica]